jgi:hypothetical protein
MARKYYYNGIETTYEEAKKFPPGTPILVQDYSTSYTPPSTVAVKNDAGKLRYDLVPYDALDEIVAVFNYGAAKYADRNWESGFTFGRPIAAAFRHLSAWARGEEKDPESGLSHLAHAACNILFLIAFQLRGVGTDDRTKTTK